MHVYTCAHTHAGLYINIRCPSPTHLQQSRVHSVIKLSSPFYKCWSSVYFWLVVWCSLIRIMQDFRHMSDSVLRMPPESLLWGAQRHYVYYDLYLSSSLFLSLIILSLCLSLFIELQEGSELVGGRWMIWGRRCAWRSVWCVDWWKFGLSGRNSWRRWMKTDFFLK